MTSRRRHQILGFTLIEVLIVVAIVAIIASIAVPSYQNQVRDARRADGIAVLMQARQQMERYYSKNYSYVGATAGAPGAAATIVNQSPADGGTAYYTLALSNLAQATFTITATPAGPQVGEACGNLSITQAGVKGAAGTIDNCWR